VRAQDLENFGLNIENLKRVRQFITPQEFFASYARGGGPPPRSTLVTFDDGLLSSFQAAQQVLNPLGIKAIFFAPTGMLELKTSSQVREFVARCMYRMTVPSDALTDEQFLPMDADALRQLVADGHMVLPHTHSHLDLKDIRDEKAVQDELVRPKELLEDLLGTPMDAMAFPIGTERQVGGYSYRRIRELYRFCFTALNGANTAATDHHFLHRDCLPPDAPWSYVEMVMNGAFDLLYKVKLRRLKSRAAGSER
jgi:peptidoglycan/xylan/chitin deacetylase (PgdA/CDA1 family)